MHMIVLNTLICVYRADFVTTTSVVIAILFISDTSDINRDKFRWLPLLQFVSILYDFFWLMFIQNYSKEYDYENYIKGWSLTISWIQFVFKVSITDKNSSFLKHFRLFFIFICLIIIFIFILDSILPGHVEGFVQLLDWYQRNLFGT